MKLKQLKTLLLGCVFIFFSFTLFAQSALVRGEKTFGIETAVGAHIPTLIATPIRVVYFSGENLIYGLEYGRRGFSLTDGGVSVKDAEILNLGIFSRLFFTDSWNILFGVNKRTVKMKITADIQDQYNTPFGGNARNTTSSLETTAVTGSLGLGTQWNFDFFYINMDYFLKSGNLGSSVSSSVNTDADPVTGAESSAARKDLEDLGTSINNIIQRNGYFILSVGFAF